MGLSIEVAMLVLIAAVLHATWNTFIKASGDSLVTSTVIMATGSSLCVLALPWVPLPSTETWPFIAASVAIHNVYFLLLLQAYRFADLSQAYPIARGTSPLIVAVFSGAVVGERLGWLQLGGAGLVAIGIGSLAGVGSAQRAVDRRGVFYALACGLSIGAFALVDAVGVRTSQNVFSFILWLTALECLPLVTFTIVRRRGRLLRSVVECGPRAVLGGVLAAVAYATVLWAYDNGPVAPVAALRETSVVMAALIGALRLGEPFGLRRVLAAAVVVAGVALLNRV
ncbi:MAG: EamA family transporter [Candidatus Binatia bacterium]|nr:EamA family transporter [Candidatus Binatia bacterium]